MSNGSHHNHDAFHLATETNEESDDDDLHPPPNLLHGGVPPPFGSNTDSGSSTQVDSHAHTPPTYNRPQLTITISQDDQYSNDIHSSPSMRTPVSPFSQNDPHTSIIDEESTSDPDSETVLSMDTGHSSSAIRNDPQSPPHSPLRPLPGILPENVEFEQESNKKQSKSAHKSRRKRKHSRRSPSPYGKIMRKNLVKQAKRGRFDHHEMITDYLEEQINQLKMLYRFTSIEDYRKVHNLLKEFYDKEIRSQSRGVPEQRGRFARFQSWTSIIFFSFYGNFIIAPLGILAWRGLWTRYDIYLPIENKWSAWVCLIFGYLLLALLNVVRWFLNYVLVDRWTVKRDKIIVQSILKTQRQTAKQREDLRREKRRERHQKKLYEDLHSGTDTITPDNASSIRAPDHDPTLLSAADASYIEQKKTPPKRVQDASPFQSPDVRTSSQTSSENGDEDITPIFHNVIQSSWFHIFTCGFFRKKYPPNTYFTPPIGWTWITFFCHQLLYFFALQSCIMIWKAWWDIPAQILPANDIIQDFVVSGVAIILLSFGDQLKNTVGSPPFLSIDAEGRLYFDMEPEVLIFLKQIKIKLFKKKGAVVDESQALL